VVEVGGHIICIWAQDERPADLHMAQPNVPVRKTGHCKDCVAAGRGMGVVGKRVTADASHA
jgi:hypothetical protein